MTGKSEFSLKVEAADAQQLIEELDQDQVSVEDLVLLPMHHCYVRATVDGRREPTYSLAVREPEPGDPHQPKVARAPGVSLPAAERQNHPAQPEPAPA